MAQNFLVTNPCVTCGNTLESQFRYLAINPTEEDVVRECEVCGCKSACNIENADDAELSSVMKYELNNYDITELHNVSELNDDIGFTEKKSIDLSPNLETTKLIERPMESSPVKLIKSSLDEKETLSPAEKIEEHFDIHSHDIETLENLIFSQPCRKCDMSDKDAFSYVSLHHKDRCHYRQCMRCNDLLGIDDSLDSQTMLAQLQNNKFQFCNCGNTNINALIIATEIASIICEVCGAVLTSWSAPTGDSSQVDAAAASASSTKCTNTSSTKLTASSSPQETPNKPTIEGRTKITNFNELQKGDHVMMERVFVTGYWHHAIVFDVTDNNSMTLIHFSPVEKEKLKSLGLNSPEDLNRATENKAKVIIEEVDRTFTGDSLYRVDYAKSDSVFSVDEVIARAWKYIEMVGYNLLLKNCEHFARWCKTNKWMSMQVTSFFHQLSDLAGFKRHATSVARKVLQYALSESGNGGKRPGLSNVLTNIIWTSGTEAYNAYQDIKKDKQRLQEHAITQKEFEMSKAGRFTNCVVTCMANAVITMGVTQGGGMLLALIPSIGPALAFTVPILGTVVGVTVGKALGLRAESKYRLMHNQKKEIKAS